MRVVVTQPYFLPYLPYFSLLACADKVIFLDDVLWGNHKWIYRNRFLIRGKDQWRGLSLKEKSQNLLLMDLQTRENSSLIKLFIEDFVASYESETYVSEAMEILDVMARVHSRYVASYSIELVIAVCEKLGVKLNWERLNTSRRFNDMKGQERIISLVKSVGGTEYVNQSSGFSLYQENSFAAAGLNLKFILPRSNTWRFSILHDLAVSGGHQLQRNIQEYDLLCPGLVPPQSA